MCSTFENPDVGHTEHMSAGTAGYRGRLAPSPTGYLHLGHARTFLMAAERARGGVLVLRDEDLDRDRARPEFARAMVEDLRWLGIRWQEGVGAGPSRSEPMSDDPDIGHTVSAATHLGRNECDEGGAWPAGLEEIGAFGPYRQSARMALYRKVVAELVAAGAVYRCSCSRRDLLAAARAPHAEDDDEPVYTGTCRRRGCAGEGALRFRVPDGAVISFVDGNLGPQRFIAGVDFGDFVVERRDGVPSYQLACVADDFAMGITEVVRGRDLLRSTARQMLLRWVLRYPSPRYYHCGLMVDADGQRLAKRSDGVSLRALRLAGKTAEAVRALAMGGVVR